MQVSPLASQTSHSPLQFIFPRPRVGDTISIPLKKSHNCSHPGPFPRKQHPRSHGNKDQPVPGETGEPGPATVRYAALAGWLRPSADKGASLLAETELANWGEETSLWFVQSCPSGRGTPSSTGPPLT